MRTLFQSIRAPAPISTAAFMLAICIAPCARGQAWNDSGRADAGIGYAAGAWAGGAGTGGESAGLESTGRESELTCLQQAIAYEAGTEPLQGKQAVAEVILNRTHNPRFPTSVCGVVHQGSTRTTGCQFTFTCDGSLRRRLSDRVMAEARLVASAALDRQIPNQVSGAINYHADYVQPYWAATMVRVTKIGRHIFYRSPGDAPAVAAPARDQAPQREPATTAPAFSLWGLKQP